MAERDATGGNNYDSLPCGGQLWSNEVLDGVNRAVERFEAWSLPRDLLFDIAAGHIAVEELVKRADFTDVMCERINMILEGQLHD